ncbi:Gfo/Idh/MocA family protein [Saccharopolyspora phatthalungensis]|uniref:Putative dehydrogenase n=1 Tax=Saccharopolyspora phatthalungensis TaxID=664693 RepID=A0A840QJ56_9PSEU|nr:Gfo/Idh/MocA family oxidoreductase [Saccharopolyspora phatthalungensis]MBB5158795.1 putative dehydrogenase [Saccharopolyspora phatthalungensis]
MSARRIGIVGLGVISKFYLAALTRLPHWELAAVCDVRDSALAPHREHAPCYRDHRSMLAAADLDAVVVTVPNDAHAEVCRDALLAGIPVCVEKPLAISGIEGRELDALARERGIPLFTAFHRRYNDNVLALRRELPADARIESLRVRYLERIEEHIGSDTWYLDPQRCGGGCVADNGPNAFDLVRQFLGDVEVSGADVRHDEAGIDRHALIELRSAEGNAATVELDWSYPGEIKDVEVRLDNGTVLRADMLAHHSGFKSSLWHEYVGILEDFADTVSTGSTTSDGLAALELVEASYRKQRSTTIVQE